MSEDMVQGASEAASAVIGHPGTQRTFLPMREWLELGQVLNDRCPVRNYKFFRSWHTQMIRIGTGCSLDADGKTYGPGEYFLDPGRAARR